MFNAVNLESGTDWELNKKYKRAIDLAMDICQESKEQFKLVETPLKSFLLVSNVLPDDHRPWASLDTENFDFSNIDLNGVRNVHAAKINFKVKDEARVFINTPVSRGHFCFAAYDFSSVMCSMRQDKNKIISEAIELLANPKTWNCVIPKDPLPWLWLLFYGKFSICSSENCLYRKYFHTSGPVLFPPHIYSPKRDIESFIRHVCAYVAALYGSLDNFEDAFPKGLELPFSCDRLNNLKHEFNYISDAVYPTRVCLLCCLYKQNIRASKRQIPDAAQPVITLTGPAQQFLSGEVGNFRSLSLGHNFLFPGYHIEELVRSFEKHESTAT